MQEMATDGGGGEEDVHAVTGDRLRRFPSHTRAARRLQDRVIRSPHADSRCAPVAHRSLACAVRGSLQQSVAVCGRLWPSVAVCGRLWQVVGEMECLELRDIAAKRGGKEKRE